MTLPPTLAAPDHWHRLHLERLGGEFVRQEGGSDFELRTLELAFASTTVILPAHLEWLLVDPDLMRNLQELKFVGGRWGGDWVSLLP